MSGLFVPLDVEYWHDEKLVEAGPRGIGDPLAELLYVRAMTFCKRTMNDGRIKASQIDSFALRIPQARKRWQYLVDTGAIIEQGGVYVMPAFLKRNKAAADINGDRDARTAASVLANHSRWHTGPDGKRNPKCIHCRSDSDAKADVRAIRSDSHGSPPQPEPEGEPQGEPKPEGEGIPSDSSSSSKALLDQPPDDDDDRYLQAINVIVEAKATEHGKRAHRGWQATTRANTAMEDGATLRQHLAAGLDPIEAAAQVLGSKVAATLAADALGITATAANGAHP